MKRSTRVSEMQKFHFLDSVLYLNGNISSQLRADIVEDQVLGIPGLLEVENNLVGDDRLAAELARALALDIRTRDLPIGIYPQLGEARLSEAVHTSEQKAVVEETVRDFPGACSVILRNYLTPLKCAQLLRPFVVGATSMGLGLGLYLANRIAEAHYGTLMVDSPAGRGVRVTLALPMEDEDLSEFNHEEYGLSDTIVFRA